MVRSKWGAALIALLVFLMGVGLQYDVNNVVHPQLMKSRADFSFWVTLFWVLAPVVPTLWYWRTALAEKFAVKQREEWLRPVTIWRGLQRNVIESLVRGVTLKSAKVPKSERPEVLRKEIRLVLSEVLALIEGVEPKRAGERYAVNLMRRIPVRDLLPDVERQVRNATRLEDMPPAKAWGAVSAVLYLDHRLSTASAKQSGKVDPKMTDIVFLLRSPDRTPAGAWTCMPGAPVAAAGNLIVGLTREELLSACDGSGHDCDDGALARLKAYLDSPAGTEVKSFVSVPISLDGDDDAVAVLNVHSNRTELLRDETTRDLVAYLPRPLTLVLITLLEELDKHERPDVTPGSTVTADGS